MALRLHEVNPTLVHFPRALLVVLSSRHCGHPPQRPTCLQVNILDVARSTHNETRVSSVPFEDQS